jgi:flagellar motility protein MotE (MotC chaperone)/sporulation protein YlmC with PRC-barrel domain
MPDPNVSRRYPAQVSGPATKVFIARLAGIAVFDPNGDQVGRVRDVVVLLRLEQQPPRVLGIVVEVQPRRRIFVPISRVTAIDAGQLIIHGTVSLRRFEQRPVETLVLGEMLDRRVTINDSGETATVVDVAMEPTRTRDWVVTRVALRSGGGLRRRRTHVRTLDWDEITGFGVVEEQQGAANLLAAFDQLRPADLAGVMHELSPKRRLEVAAALDDERLADVLEELPEDDQVEILGQLATERAADVLEAMAPDDAADLLGDLPAEEAQRLLSLMEPEEAAPVRRLLIYADNTAGGLMTSEPVILPPDASIAEALARVRNPELTPALAAQVYVCRPPTATPTGKYLGIAHTQRLLREPPSSLVSGVVDTDIGPLQPDAALPVVTSYLATYNLVAVPIVDDDDHLLGAVTVDDVLDHLLPEGWRERPLDARDEESVGGS